MPLNTLSRLKGIETKDFSEAFPHVLALNTLSRLKGIETLTFQLLSKSGLLPLNTLSRLKGIETSGLIPFQALDLISFEYTFPFEGN